MKHPSKQLFVILLIFSFQFSFSQTVSNIKADPNLKMGEFTNWIQETAKFDDNSQCTFEYRIALVKRVGIGCHYELEVKNTSDKAYEFKIASHYYDKLVKSYFGDKSKEKIKPGKITNIHFVAQGCKKEKGIERTDYEHCLACDCTVDITVNK